jgi:CRISPR-associated protein Csx17
MNAITVAGCAPVPLAHYLKALAILRLVAEQRDISAKGSWQGDTFVLNTALDTAALVEFFLKDYHPTPILVPWSGGDFFAVNRGIEPDKLEKKFKKRPTSSNVVEAILATTTERLHGYRIALDRTFAAMDLCGLKKKKDIEGSGNAQKLKKADFLQALRNFLPDDALQWVDAAAVIRPDAFSPNNLLGSGGGSDGNSHFSDNFMQALWAVLPEFDCQRATAVAAAGGRAFDSRLALQESLFARAGNNTHLKKLSPVLFDSTRVGGPNSISGFDSEAASNPWDFILMIEGACLFAGALSKKIGAANPSTAHFPFLLGASPIGAGSLGQVESSGKEIWLPIWESTASAKEVAELFAAGRIESHKRVAAHGIDAAQAVCQYGVDCGIDSFQRIGLFRGRIGGDNYFTSAHLGRFVVSRNPSVDLLGEFDPWLIAFRDKAGAGRAPASINRVLRKLESAVFDVCQRTDTARIQQVLIQLGKCEQAMVHSLTWAINSFARPVTPLSYHWLEAANDGSPEYQLAASLSSVHGRYGKNSFSLRRQLEPVTGSTKNGASWLEWDKGCIVDVAWHEGDVIDAMNAVMRRRLVLAQKDGGRIWPDTGRLFAKLSDIATFIENSFNRDRFAELLWGLALLDWPRVPLASRSTASSVEWRGDAFPRSAYALLKLCFAGTPVHEVGVPLLPAIHQHAAAGKGTLATELAAGRLRASGLAPSVERVQLGGPTAATVAAALLFPIARGDVEKLAGAVLRLKNPKR